MILFCSVNSEGLIDYLVMGSTNSGWGFSVYVQDLYYSLPHGPLMQCVYDCITKDNDEVEFRNTCGMTVEAFLELLEVYIRNTHNG